MAEMQAGRELDMRIALEVLELPPELVHTQEGGKHVEFAGRMAHVAATDYYSTEIGAAWQVVEEMHRRCWRFSGGDDYGVIGVRTGFTVQLEEHDHKAMTGRETRGGGETFPLAICRAALKALEASHG